MRNFVSVCSTTADKVITSTMRLPQFRILICGAPSGPLRSAFPRASVNRNNWEDR
jgi:hypothetical protein